MAPEHANAPAGGRPEPASLISRRQPVGYALADEAFVIQSANAVMQGWSSTPTVNIVGAPLTAAFLELVGQEATLRALADGRHEPIVLRRINRPDDNGASRYFDLYVESMTDYGARLLLTATDVTDYARQQQLLVQQRNELALLGARLDQANAQLAYLLERFVPREVARRLIEERRLPEPGGEYQREATILFADMRNFSALAERGDPGRVMDIVNRYLDVIAAPIRDEEGSVIQIVGDLLMASFNVPVEQPDHVRRACRAALAIQAALADFVARHDAEALPALGFGLGVATGPVTAGYLGVSDRYRFAVFGDTTNIAFHLCARAAAGETVISADTYHLLGDATGESLGEVTMKRRRETIKTFRLTAL